MNVKTILLACILTATALSVISQRKPSPATQPLTLTIGLHGWATASGFKGYLAGKPISIRSVWKNTGTKPISFLLKDHDPYHGTLAFPLFLWARVTEPSGRVLTKSNAASGVGVDGWWVSSLNGSNLFIHGTQMPGDIITLKPGEVVTRIVHLDEVLSGLSTLPNGLQPGTYTVEFFHSDPLNGIDTMSNKLMIKVVAEK
jgi:hypothetical protein